MLTYTYQTTTVIDSHFKQYLWVKTALKNLQKKVIFFIVLDTIYRVSIWSHDGFLF